MKKIGTFFIWGVIFLSVACGRKTAPSPFAMIAQELPLITVADIKYQEQQQIIHWQIPGKFSDAAKDKIDIYEVSLLVPSALCRSCEPELKGKFLIHSDTGDVTLDSFHLASRQVELPQFSRKGKDLFLKVQVGSFPQALQTQSFYYQIQYITVQGKYSGKSFPLVPRSPQFIASPNFEEFRVLGDLIYIRWVPVQETTQSILQSDGSFMHGVKYFGINFYELSPEGLEKLINAKPILGPGLTLPFKQQKIIARSVDRFGNESAATVIFGKKGFKK